MIPVDDVIGRADWIAWPLGHWTRLGRADDYARVPAAAGRGAPAASGPSTADGVHG